MDYYTDAFYGVKETLEQTGYTLPQHIEAYIVILLEYQTDNMDFSMDRRSAKELGDTSFCNWNLSRLWKETRY